MAGVGVGVPFHRGQPVVLGTPAAPSLRPADSQGSYRTGDRRAAVPAFGGNVMRTRSLLTLAVAVVALTVVSGRTAWAQASCTVDTDCNFCNSETCTGGVCVSSGGGDPCASGLECNNTCDPAARNCLTPAGTACTDDGNACTADGCDGTGACVHTPVSNCCTTNAECDDALGCTVDTCDTGSNTCVHAPLCDDGDVCTTDSCNEPGVCTFSPVAGCCHTDVECDDGSACTNDSCDTGQHICNHADTCNDGLFCNGVETCKPDGTACDTGNPPNPPCDDASICTVDTCDENLQQCTHTPVPNCCTGDGDCADGNACTTDTCDTGTSMCQYAPVPNCCNVDSECDDADACTTDTCDPGSHPCHHS